MPAGAVLVHGLWHGAWVWEPVQQRLTDAGIASIAVELPLNSLVADEAVAREALRELDRPAVLVGHSYGGAVITGAGSSPSTIHLVYLAAFQLDEGESVSRTLPHLDVPSTRLSEALRFDDDLVHLDPQLAAELMYNGVPEQVTAEALARLRPVHSSVFSGTPGMVTWRTVESTYVVCTDDLTVHPDLQRAMANRATRRIDWDCGHSPAAARPDAVADLIIALARQ
ncbi:MAG TPA: alpha/beta hydrolase [Jatrophihabitantaceae bacterium]|nr:alpha/beta hydrolase [Jatrophihabitantaceae bacterium]